MLGLQSLTKEEEELLTIIITVYSLQVENENSIFQDGSTHLC